MEKSITLFYQWGYHPLRGLWGFWGSGSGIQCRQMGHWWQQSIPCPEDRVVPSRRYYRREEVRRVMATVSRHLVHLKEQLTEPARITWRFSKQIGWTSRPLSTKVCLVNAMIFPVVVYGCESWSIKKAERWRIDAFELRCRRRLLRFPGLLRDQTSQS